jgi:hypothetical protein
MLFSIIFELTARPLKCARFLHFQKREKASQVIKGAPTIIIARMMCLIVLSTMMGVVLFAAQNAFYSRIGSAPSSMSEFIPYLKTLPNKLGVQDFTRASSTVNPTLFIRDSESGAINLYAGAQSREAKWNWPCQIADYLLSCLLSWGGTLLENGFDWIAYAIGETLDLAWDCLHITWSVLVYMASSAILFTIKILPSLVYYLHRGLQAGWVASRCISEHLQGVVSYTYPFGLEMRNLLYQNIPLWYNQIYGCGKKSLACLCDVAMTYKRTVIYDQLVWWGVCIPPRTCELYFAIVPSLPLPIWICQLFQLVQTDRLSVALTALFGL